MSHAIPDPGAVVAARVRATSIAAVARDLGLARETVARIAAGFPVREGTVLLLRKRLGATSEARRLASHRDAVPDEGR
jgi:plasmid maintenance system antidote protein VapI